MIQMIQTPIFCGARTVASNFRFATPIGSVSGWFTKEDVVVGHALKLTLAPMGTRRPHGGKCECGWVAERSMAAGLVHAEHDAHLAQVEAETDDEEEAAA